MKRRRNTRRSNASIDASSLSDFYRSVMTDTLTSSLTDDQIHVRDTVSLKFNELSSLKMNCDLIYSDKVEKCIKSLKRNSSPGLDGVTSEYLVHGNSSHLCRCLASLYTQMLTYNYVPTCFSTGVIIPILKKATLDPNIPKNYRPITLSSIYSKLFEAVVMPDVDLNSNQFGFRKGCGTSFGIGLLNDLLCHYKHSKSPMYICSLDAEKCFDSLWHDGLFYKLQAYFPDVLWRFLYKWYCNLTAVIKWNGQVHTNLIFNVSRGTRQGSLLSPYLFNMFLSDLLYELDSINQGLRIGSHLYNSFAYADDVSLFASTVPGLQQLINKCVEYSVKWRFKFGLAKSQCLIPAYCVHICENEPNFYLGSNPIQNAESVEILGVTFTSKCDFTHNVDNRITKCRNSSFSLSDVGMCYPGTMSDTKSYLFQSICQPTLLYGLDAVNLSSSMIKKLENVQGSIMKRVCGIPKRSHHTQLLQSLNISSVNNMLLKSVTSLYNRIFKINSPLRDLCVHDLSVYMSCGKTIPGTITHRITQLGLSPVDCAFTKHIPCHKSCNNGVVDSLSQLIHCDNFIKPWSDEYLLAVLLTKAF